METSDRRPLAVSRGLTEKALRDARRLEIEKWHRAHCVGELPDDIILGAFSYADDARLARVHAPEPGWMRKLLAQVASLSTDLPEGIYVRHGESRLDLLKILIVGPVGTPYENGLFEFDLYCDKSFPIVPPKVNFRTTGNGTVQFNPNLYSNGTVCLSLLGTWSGHPWEQDRSTILQVLVSIQAMIFNDQPWYNEPGYERRSSPAQAERYNRHMASATIQHAMFPWLEQRLATPNGPEGVPRPRTVRSLSPPTLFNTSIPFLPSGFSQLSSPAATIHPRIVAADDPIWGDVIRKHFELRADMIMSTVRDWEEETVAAAKPQVSPMAGVSEDLEHALRQHGFLK